MSKTFGLRHGFLVGNLIYDAPFHFGQPIELPHPAHFPNAWRKGFVTMFFMPDWRGGRKLEQHSLADLDQLGLRFFDDVAMSRFAMSQHAAALGNRFSFAFRKRLDFAQQQVSLLKRVLNCLSVFIFHNWVKLKLRRL